MTDIDMKSFSGEDVSAAEGQIAATMQYDDSNVNQEILDQVQSELKVEAPKSIENPQAENFKALRDEVDRIKTEREQERRDYQQQLELLKANVYKQQPHEQKEMPSKMFQNMQDDDIPSVGEIRKEWQNKELAYQNKIQELEIAQTFSDYKEVMEKYTIPLIKNKPHLAQGIMGAENKALYAYELGKLYQQQTAPVQTQQPEKNANAQRIVENAKKPGSFAQAGGNATFSKADYYASMSDNEFMQMATKNLGEI